MVCISKQHLKRAQSHEVSKSGKAYTDTLYLTSLTQRTDGQDSFYRTLLQVEGR
jgi:hypothetical protein